MNKINKKERVGKVEKTLFVSTLFLLVSLTGCSSMNSSFDCPNKPGVTCKSIDQVNDMVDRGFIGRDFSIKNDYAPKYYSKQKQIKNSLGAANKFNLSNSLRSGEQVVRVWIAPYQDVHSNYHNESTLYVVVRKNNWAVPTEVIEQG